LKFLGAVSATSWRALVRLALVLLAAWLVGLAFGRVALVLTVVLTICLAIQIVNLLRVEHWLRHRRVEAPPDVRGTWAEVVAIIDRIYRRKRYHKAHVTALLREFRRLTTAMPEGAVLLGPGNEILWFNPRVSSWLGLRRKRDLGMRIENLVRHPEFVEYLRTGQPEDGVIVRDFGEAGRCFSFHVVRTGEQQQQLLIVRDVSREQHLQSMRKDFVANASHELRSPLTVISGYLDALADDQHLDPAWHPPVMEMRRQAERMSLIINDLLELSKLESSNRLQGERPIDVGALLSSLKREAMEQHPQSIDVQLDSDAWLMGAESELHSAIANLLTNALKYTPREGHVELRWWTDEEGAYVSVRDTGSGIAPEHIPRLTERFYRVDAGRARDAGGSGLGLAIVKHALQRHGATLSIDSTEGVGSTFTCRFPRERVLSRSAALAQLDAGEGWSEASAASAPPKP
jgi:two-component system phosphate regulon sensor histidine kinase PhoR